MSEQLRTYYQNELGYLREMGEQFARDYPKIAERLVLSAENSGDPHVERMIEAFALVSAQIRLKLDDELPEVTDALLNVLYPHYLAPLPSVGIVQVALSPQQATLKDGFALKRGSPLETEPAAGGTACIYRTCYNVTAWPFTTRRALMRPAMRESDVRFGATALVTVTLSAYTPETPFCEIPLDTLRFHLKGQDRDTQLLYELLMTSTTAVTIETPGEPETISVLPHGSLRPAGFAEDEAMLPVSNREFPGFRLLSEYFLLSRKFLFIDIANLRPALKGRGDSIELTFHLSRTSPILERVVSAEMLALGCTPVVNLFRKRCEPIHLSQTQSEYRVVPDSRNPAGFEIYSIDRAVASAPDGRAVEYHPLFSSRHRPNADEHALYWQAQRRNWSAEEASSLQGGDMLISLSDLAMNPREAPNWILDIEATCCNRSVPDTLPAGVGRPEFRIIDGGPVAATPVMQPTATLRPGVRRHAMWRLISHLALNHESLFDHDGSAARLREALQLYAPGASAENRARIASILSLRHKPAVARIRGQVNAGWIKGLALELEIDEEQAPNNGGYLMANVLERFLSMFVSINSFTQLNVSSRKRQGDPWRWPARSCEKILL